MSTDPISLDVALDIARHPGSFGGSMKALALDVLAGQVEQLRAELARRDTTIAAARRVVTGWNEGWWRVGPTGDAAVEALYHALAALSAPVEAGATEPTQVRADCGGDDHEWVRCSRCPTDGPCACAGGPCCERELVEARGPRLVLCWGACAPVTPHKHLTGDHGPCPALPVVKAGAPAEPTSDTEP